MRLVRGEDMFAATAGLVRPHIIVVTTNGVIRNGALVMGKGAAGQAAKFFPHLPASFAKAILDQNEGYAQHHGQTVYYYGLVNVGDATWLSRQFMALQTKGHWKDPSYIELVSGSLEKLKDWTNRNLSHEFHMNYPGIGLGGLRLEEIQPLLEGLPDNVLVYRK